MRLKAMALPVGWAVAGGLVGGVVAGPLGALVGANVAAASALAGELKSATLFKTLAGIMRAQSFLRPVWMKKFFAGNGLAGKCYCMTIDTRSDFVVLIIS